MHGIYIFSLFIMHVVLRYCSVRKGRILHAFNVVPILCLIDVVTKTKNTLLKLKTLTLNYLYYVNSYISSVLNTI